MPSLQAIFAEQDPGQYPVAHFTVEGRTYAVVTRMPGSKERQRYWLRLFVGDSTWNTEIDCDSNTQGHDLSGSRLAAKLASVSAPYGPIPTERGWESGLPEPSPRPGPSAL